MLHQEQKQRSSTFSYQPALTLGNGSYRHYFLKKQTHKPLPQLFNVEELSKIQLVDGQKVLVDAVTKTYTELYTECEFPVRGQGTVLFEFNTTQPFRIVLSDQKVQSNGQRSVLVLDVGDKHTYFRKRNNDESEDVLSSTTEMRALLESGKKHKYWISLDKKNRRLRFGKGYMHSQLCVFEFSFSDAGAAGKENSFAWIENIRYVALCGAWNEIDVKEIQHELWPLPVTIDLPPYIIRNEVVTLDEMESCLVTVVENLPQECQHLYANVAAPNILLNSPDFPDFADAINHSIITPGCICYEMLKSKAGEFGKSDPKATYLRVTVGVDRGDSPGIPYVLEIWPGGHYSPIHSHANSYAIIKILHGEIVAEYYPELSIDQQDYFTCAYLKKGDVTWLSNDFYQTHRLYNHKPEGEMCATIQCYEYGGNDRTHYEFFDYIDEEAKQIKQFTPNTDWSYGEFKHKLKEEWSKYKSR
ncbi:hypothetical protein [Microcoleus sp. B4-D4]|uniref:hypothetical protein n=1 Tax=Microcoleus sp. B4-D4 TaxID=2818667 RepID=UPI002FD70AFC